jgi:hypothetical protein
MGILGAVVLTTLWVLFGGYFQNQDRVTARGEIEYVFQKIGKEITNVSLGMPNNRLRIGTFADSFRSSLPQHHPVMGHMGTSGASWGGPVTVASFDPVSELRNFGKMVTDPVSPGSLIYVGPQVYYAWAELIVGQEGGVRFPLKVLPPEDGNIDFEKGEVKRFRFAFPNSAAKAQNFTLNDGRSMGLVAAMSDEGTKDMRSWVTFPTLRIPMLVRDINVVDNTIDLQLAPYCTSSLQGILGGYEELYTVQACRLYVNERRELVQEIFGANYMSSAETANTVNILTHNVAGMFFRFDQENRLLTMYLAIMGEEVVPADVGGAAAWPPFASPLPPEASRRRVEAQSITWRIRN